FRRGKSSRARLLFRQVAAGSGDSKAQRRLLHRMPSDRRPCPDPAAPTDPAGRARLAGRPALGRGHLIDTPGPLRRRADRRPGLSSRYGTASVTRPPALVDSHCHLAFEAFEPDRPAVVERARQAGVAACVVVAVDGRSAAQALELAEAWPGWAHATAGIH